MITIFAVPRPFIGRTALIQRNALASWQSLTPRCQIILLGGDEGVAEVAHQSGVIHISDVGTTEFGTPLLDSVFDLARRKAAHALLCYVNADIILLDDFTRAVSRIQLNDFLLVGRRTDLDVGNALDTGVDGWQSRFRARARREGRLFPPNGIDYFVFPAAGHLGYLPPFAVGRPAWDNWFIRDARQKRVPVVDLTRSVMAIHQNHSYEHVPNRRGGTAEGPEADQNRSLFDTTRYYDIRNATHAMRWGIVYPALYRRYILPVPRLIWDSRHRIRHAVRLRTRVRQLRSSRLGRKSA